MLYYRHHYTPKFQTKCQCPVQQLLSPGTFQHTGEKHPPTNTNGNKINHKVTRTQRTTAYGLCEEKKVDEGSSTLFDKSPCLSMLMCQKEIYFCFKLKFKNNYERKYLMDDFF